MARRAPRAQRSGDRYARRQRDSWPAARAEKENGDRRQRLVTARVFGGPVFWRFDGEDVVGTDLYKYQLGGGLSLTLADGQLDLFAEGIPLGERGVAAGIGTTFF